ncbi:hypothetical protein [Cutibacterium sp. V947]|uniref:hypothetical protein n=1 Tax=unclassified Cutibacterium TaxID=2649671 RepID=UPI003EE41454
MGPDGHPSPDERIEIPKGRVADSGLLYRVRDHSLTVADAFLLDPLAHVEIEYRQMVLRHKTVLVLHL